MKLTYDTCKVRFYLSWRTSCKLGHDVSKLNPLVDALPEAIQNIVGWESGSGHTGLYVDLELDCHPGMIEGVIKEIKKRANRIWIKA
jgi:hypothetical protein